MKTYFATFTAAEEGGYLVTFPDLDGCFTEGDDFAQALEMAVDVLAMFLAHRKQQPESSRFEALKNVLSPGVQLVPVPLDSKLFYRYSVKQKVNTSLPTPFVIEVDSYIARTGQDRSEFLAEAGRLYMEQNPV